MATTSIHAITKTVGKAIDYITADKVEKYLRDDISPTINYLIDEISGDVTYKTLVGTQGCSNPINPAEDFDKFSHYFGRDAIANGCLQSKNGSPILAWHLVQSFDSDINPVMANEIGLKLAENTFGFRPMIVATHTNTSNTHNHIIASAWDYDGKKWHCCHESYRKIRKYSDQLCQEYGLNILDKTRDQVLVRWTDKDGNTRYFEPTARKEELREQRRMQETYSDDVGSYRHSLAYDFTEKDRAVNIAVVKADIDETLPYAKSFAELLSLLKDQGYEIISHKQNNDWRKHITYISPLSNKGVLDYTLGPEYTRERLSEIIHLQNQEIQNSVYLQHKHNLQIYQDYRYGDFDVQSLNEDYRAYRMRDNTIRVVQRKDLEKTIIRSIKATDLELHDFCDMTYINRLIEQQRRADIKKTEERKRELRLIKEIQDNFQTLKFLEVREIFSRQEIEAHIQRLTKLVIEGKENLDWAEKTITQFSDHAALSDAIDRLNELRLRLEKAEKELDGYVHCLATLTRIESNRKNKNHVSPHVKKQTIEQTR